MITADINETNIDLISRYRNGGGTGTWQSDWNIFSKRTFEKLVQAESRGHRLSFQEIAMPFDLAAQPNPMRTWTVDMNGKQTLINGAGLILPSTFIEIHT